MEMTMQRVNSKTPNLDAVTALSRTLTLVRLSEDPEEARVKYVKLRQAVRELFEIFLRNLNLKSLHALEQQFNSKGDLQIGDFLRVFMRVFPQPDPLVWTDRGERLFIVQLAIRLLFESMDVDNGGEVSWQEFVEFVCAIAEELRLKAAEESGQTFEFHTSKVVAPFKPYVTRCVFDQVYYWPEHPSDSAIIFEEGQTGFNLHRPSNMQRKRRVDGHSGELLAAVYMPAPYEWVVTSANDKTICFWDSTFMLIKKWSLDQVMGALCWCHEIGVLYAAEHFTEKFRAWRINDPLSMRACEGALKPDKTYNLSNASGHTKAVQSICWLGNMTSLATASLDGKVVIYDLVLKKRAHVLTNHKKGVCFLAFCPKNHMLLSGGFDSFICIWDPGAGILTHMLEEHDCSLAGLCYVPATDYEFVSVDFDGMVKHWDVRRLVCLQSWSASDKVAEKAGDLEALDPRAICALGPNRILITGRRMVVFDRDCIDPHVTTDWPINAIAFNQTRIEIVTPIKNDIYVWCALTGELLTVHDNLTEGMITAVTLGLGERRFFLGADDGQIQVVNYACGAKLKVLTPHTCEVTQIECIPEKVVTLSTAEKLIMVHDDNDPIKSVVLKRIDVSSAGSIIQMAMDHAHGIIAAATEDGEVVWLSSEFAKQVSDSESCVVQHNTAVGCVRYFEKAPLMVTADAEASVIFWSVPPLRTYDFFRKVTIRGCAKSRTITSLNMDPDEELLYVGLDSGELYAVGISQFCAIAKQQEADVKRLKKAGMRQDLIFDSMPKPIDSPDYVFELDAMWCVDKAHKGMIDTIIVCKRRVPVVLTLGTDQCVRIWGYDSGDALGTVEQGLPEGLAWERLSPWRFPMDALEELEQDKQAVLSALEDGIEEEDDDDAEEDAPSPPKKLTRSGSKLRAARQGGKELDKLRQSTASATEKERPLTGAAAEQQQLTGMSFSAGAKKQTRKKGELYAPSSRLLQPRKSNQGLKPFGEDWFAGSYSSVARGKSMSGSSSLPSLPRASMRPSAKECKEVTEAAKRLSMALGASSRLDIRSA